MKYSVNKAGREITEQKELLKCSEITLEIRQQWLYNRQKIPNQDIVSLENQEGNENTLEWLGCFLLSKSLLGTLKRCSYSLSVFHEV